MRVLAILLFCCSSVFAESIAITNGKIHTMAGPVIEKGTVLLKDGKIVAVGEQVSVPSDARVIDAQGKTVLPGLIDPNCHVGLVEISQASETVDQSESTDPITPHMRVTDGFFPESQAIGVSRKNGITSCVVSPNDVNLLSGVSAMIEFSGKRLDAVVLQPAIAMNGTLGEAPKEEYGTKNKMPMTRMGSAALLRQTLTQAREYVEKWQQYEKKKSAKDAKTPDRDLKLESLQDVLSGKLPFVVSAHRVDDILTAIRIAEEFGIKQNLIINHGTDAYKIADRLAKEKVPVIVGPVTTQPDRMETLGAIYENAAILQKAGVLIAIQTDEVHNVRNLPYEAGIAVAHELPYEEALKAITINAAKIFRIDSQIGSIEAGKRANIIIAAGDPLEPRTEITHVFIGGEEMPLTNYHQQLWEEVHH